MLLPSNQKNIFTIPLPSALEERYTYVKREIIPE
jgi:hypothetical protein